MNRDSSALASVASLPAVMVIPGILVGVVAVQQSIMILLARQKVKKDDGVVDPPHVGSWLPYIGSAIEMGSCDRILDFVRKYSKKFGDAPLFSALIGGNHCLFVADSRFLPPLVFGGRGITDSLEQESLHVEFLTKFAGFPLSDIQNMMHNKEIAKKVRQHYDRYLLKRTSLEKNVPEVQSILNELVDKMVVQDNAEWQRFGLCDMVYEHFFIIAMNGLMSSTPVTKDDMHAFRKWDSCLSLVLSDIPAYFVKGFFQARQTMLDLVESSSFLDNATEFIQYRRSALGFDGRMDTVLLWASVANAAPSVFWTIYYILSHPEAYESIQNEVDTVKNKHKDDDTFPTLDHLEEMQELKSAFREALRLQFGGFLVRTTSKDLVYAPKIKGSTKKYLIRKGTRIMGLPAVQHYDGAIFENPESFVWNRFASTNKVFYDRNGNPLVSPLMHFSGGLHACPGRKFIENENTAYVAHLLSKFDLRLADQQAPPPGINKLQQGVGVNQPDREVYIEIRPRNREINNE